MRVESPRELSSWLDSVVNWESSSAREFWTKLWILFLWASTEYWAAFSAFSAACNTNSLSCYTIIWLERNNCTQSSFHLSLKINSHLLWPCVTTLDNGLKTSRHFFIQSVVTPEPIVTRSYTFSRVFVFFLSFCLAHWIACVLCDWPQWLPWFFRGFTKLTWNQPYETCY